MITKIIRNVGIAILFAVITPLVTNYAHATPPVINTDGVTTAVSDITIDSGVLKAFYAGDPRQGLHEVGAVNFNCVANPSWDLMAMGFDYSNSHLYIVSGFNPLTTNDGYGFGSIFVKNTDTPLIQRPVISDGYSTYVNPGFAGCIDITGSTGNILNYNLVMMSPDSLVQSTYFAQNSASDPYKLISSSADKVTFTGTSTVEVMSAERIKSIIGIDVGREVGDNISVFAFDLGSMVIPQSTSAITFSTTQGCGNDLLKGQLPAGSLSAIPEVTSSVTLAGLVSLGLLLRNRRQL